MAIYEIITLFSLQLLLYCNSALLEVVRRAAFLMISSVTMLLLCRVANNSDCICIRSQDDDGCIGVTAQYVPQNTSLPSAQVRTSQRTQYYLPPKFVPHRERSTTFSPSSYLTENTALPFLYIRTSQTTQHYLPPMFALYREQVRTSQRTQRRFPWQRNVSHSHQGCPLSVARHISLYPLMHISISFSLKDVNLQHRFCAICSHQSPLHVLRTFSFSRPAVTQSQK